MSIPRHLIKMRGSEPHDDVLNSEARIPDSVDIAR